MRHDSAQDRLGRRLSLCPSLRLAQTGICKACGYAHGSNPGCWHEDGCDALEDIESDCSCSPTFIRVNLDDDDFNGTEDRLQTTVVHGEDDILHFQIPDPILCIYCDCMDNAYWEIVSITGDFRLRLNSEIVGVGAKVYATDLLEIEALSASTMSGSDQITFDIYEGSESGAEPLRTITRRFTTAATEIMADYNGDGVRTSYDHWRKSLNSGGRWVVARRTEPYRLWIRNESPLDTDVFVTMSGETNRPSLKSGNRILSPGYSATNSAPFAMRNSSAVLLLDASGTNSTAVVSSAVQAPDGNVLDSGALTIEVVDINLEERWIAAGGTAHYSFGDWASNSYWEIMTASGGLTVDMGYGDTFSTSTSLPAGNYIVMAHFDINAIAGATCSSGGELHVVDAVIEKKTYGVQCGSDSRVLVALDMDLSSCPANWRIEPYIQGGARLYSTRTGGTGSETLAYLSEVWVSAGSIPRDYTITATHPFVAEASDECVLQTVKVMQINIVPDLCEESPNPPPFQGMMAHTFNVTHSPIPDKHAVILYQDCIGSDFSFKDVSVVLTATILPNPDAEKGFGSWSKVDGPDSGTFFDHDRATATFLNPRKGGIYKFVYNLDLQGNAQSEGILVLPLAGASVDEIVLSDLVRADAFASNVMAKYSPRQRNNARNGKRWFYKSGAGDYLGRPDVVAVVNDPFQTVWYYNQVNDETGMGAVATWAGLPVRVAKISNFIVGYAATKIGVSSLRQNLSQYLGTGNDPSASESWEAGVNVANGADYTTTVSNMVRSIWAKSDEKNRKLWPNPMPAENHVAPEAAFNYNYIFRSPGFLYMNNP